MAAASQPSANSTTTSARRSCRQWVAVCRSWRSCRSSAAVGRRVVMVRDIVGPPRAKADPPLYQGLCDKFSHKLCDTTVKLSNLRNLGQCPILRKKTFCGMYRKSLPDLRYYRVFSLAFTTIRKDLQRVQDERKMLEIKEVLRFRRSAGLHLDKLGVIGSSPIAPIHKCKADRNLREPPDSRERRLNAKSSTAYWIIRSMPSDSPSRSNYGRRHDALPLPPPAAGSQTKDAPNRPKQAHNAPASFRRAVKHLCEIAEVPAWTPNRLRHTAATRFRKEYRIEGARALPGPSQDEHHGA